MSPQLASAAEILLNRRSSVESRSTRGQLYDWQKIIGDRTETGAMKLEKLKPKHKQVIALHLQGISNNDIARVVGYDAAWVCTVLSDPLVQPYIDKFNDMTDREIAALKARATDVFREKLESTDERVALAAADKIFKATGGYVAEQQQGVSAGEVIASALESMAKIAENVSVRSIGAAARPIVEINTIEGTVE